MSPRFRTRSVRPAARRPGPHSLVRHGGLLAAAALVLAPALAGAQQRADTARLQPVVITATRTREPAQHVAANVTVLDGRALRTAGITRVADALRTVPGVTVSQAGSYGALTSIFLRGGDGKYVKVLVDGVPVNDPGGLLDLANLSTENVDRIEIVRGPTSVLYGSDAVTGVIQIFTRRGTGPLHASVEGSGGSFGAAREALSAGGGSAARGFSFGAERERSDGIYAFNSGWRDATLSGLARAAGRGGDVALSARWTDGRAGIPTDDSGAVVDSNAYHRERRAIVALDGGWRLTSRLRARVLLGDDRARTTSSDQPDSPGDSAGYYYDTRSTVERRGADLHLEYRTSGRTAAVAGVAVERQRLLSDGTSRFASYANAPSHFDEHRRNTGYYAELLAGLGPRLDVALGGRIDDNQTFGTFDTWRASAVYALPTATHLRVAVGTAFKEPLFTEVFSTDYAIGNPDLRPERSASWEAGLTQALAGGAAEVAATWFDQRFRDLIQYRYSTTEPNYFNVGAATAHGLELSATLAPSARWRARLGWTLLHTEVTDSGFAARSGYAVGEPLLRRPSRTGTAAGEWAVLPGLRLSGDVSYTGRRDDIVFASTPRRVTLVPYTVVALAADVRPLALRGGASPLALTVRADNLLGARYTPMYGYRAPGRQLLVGARLDLGRRSR